MTDFFSDVPGPVPFAGAGDADVELAFRWYDPDRIVAGKRMEDHLRIAVCYWHSFNWPGSDVFGAGTFDRPWLDAGVDPMDAALAKRTPRSSSSTSSARRSTASTTSTWRPTGATLKETTATST